MVKKSIAVKSRRVLRIWDNPSLFNPSSDWSSQTFVFGVISNRPLIKTKQQRTRKDVLAWEDIHFRQLGAPPSPIRAPHISQPDGWARESKVVNKASSFRG
ncbi:hypothetical protein JTE90_000850 [Oedothorax gibbosus]|uniref:Uncharacterized protein n=1 Tax=Oedothorax gibbosus TaxID=931172 RepID=A0AAV6VVI5_9ARAC|nr:hypothetical protein JTE90_000850 [Oedothorax gibbosus]